MDNLFYKRIVDNSQIGYAYHKIICTEDGIPCDYEFIEVNQAFEKLTGLKGLDIAGKLVTDVIPGINSDPFEWIKTFGDIALNGGEKEFEQFSGPLNKWYKVRVHSQQKYYFITLFEEAAKHRLELEDIVVDPEYFEMIFDATPEALLVIRLIDGLIINTNSVFAELLGYSREELIGKTCSDANICVDQKYYEMITAELNDKGTFSHNEIPFLRKDGSQFTSFMSAKTVEMIAGSYGFYNIHNIDDRKRAEEALISSETRYRRLFESAKDGIIILDAETGMIQDVNPYLIDLLGFTKEQLINKAIWDIGAFSDIISNRINFLELKSKEYIRYDDMPLQTIDGRQISVEFVSNVYLVNEKKVIQCNIRNITKRKAIEGALDQSEKKYSDYIENAPHGVFVVDKSGRYIDLNRAATEITGYSKEEQLKMDIRDITAEESQNHAYELFERLSKTGAMSGELQFIHKNGSKRWWSIDAVKLSENKFLGFSSDITERRKVESDLLYLSYHDHLTNLYNRRFFEEELMRFDIKQNLPLSVIMCDVNGLKMANDSFGHDSGDQLLIHAAEAIKKVCRKEDIIARIGGDEFIVLLPKTNTYEAAQIANQIKELASEVMAASIELSISYGYETKTTENQSIVEIISNAENHMHQHKLYERSSMRSKTIDLIMNTLFEKSSREAAHSNRVSGICQSIASKMNFNKDEINQLKIAGLIHDIGKIGVDEKVLNKPGRLSIDERRDIERHPEIGWRLLSSTNEFSELARFILNHHEKWDGSGYPNGLKGDAIPLEARIICVADSYDAMTSDRSYRKGLSKEEAIFELKRCSGTQFDTEIVNVFVNLVLQDHNQQNIAEKSLNSALDIKIKLGWEPA
jgi:diguanylate cyclase (GGDEF)-like protein/PAS domain S-box-containing protein